jgi:2-oxoisovalerate dehydrogenase E1 component
VTEAQAKSEKGLAPSEGNFAREMLGRIAFIRAFEAKALALSQTNPPQIAGSLHLCAGQEAVPLGALAALHPDDQIIATYRGHGWALAAGLDPRAVFAEICQRQDGINGGRAGSAYMMAPDTRFVGENSIVGAGTTMACGVAMANLAHRNNRIVVVTIGDGAMNQGSVHEAMAFAAVRNLPVIFVVENNGWSELTATSDMFRVGRLAQRAAAYGIPGATISGTDPIGVRDSFAMAAQHAREGKGPSLLECKVPRLWGHYNRDMEHYRSKEDKRAAEEQDPLVTLGERLVLSGVLTEAEVDAIKSQQERVVEDMAREVMASAQPDALTAALHVIGKPGLYQAIEGPRPEVQEMTYIQAVNLALRAELESDPRTVLFGEDVGKSGGIFAAARNLQRDFGEDRVFDTPIAENAILGSAVGAAISGLKPIVEIMWADFIFVAIDQLINQAANVRYLTSGRCSAPMIVRTQQGVTPGSCAQHSQSIEAMLAHVPGLKIGLPATPQDAYSMLRAAGADGDPCIIIEARGLYQTKGEVDPGLEDEVGLAKLRREGSDALIVTWGAMVAPSIAAADALTARGTKTAVLDLRWLSPLDEDALRRAVTAARGQVLIVHEAVRTGGFGAEIACRIRELNGDGNYTRVRRLATADVRMPSAPVLQAALIPNAQAIEAAVLDLVSI